MRSLLFAGALALFAPVAAQAQSLGAVVVSACNTQTYSVGFIYPLTQLPGGELCDTGSGGGGGSNAAAGPTGAAVPADASYNGLNVGGTLAITGEPEP